MSEGQAGIQLLQLWAAPSCLHSWTRHTHSTLDSTHTPTAELDTHSHSWTRHALPRWTCLQRRDARGQDEAFVVAVHHDHHANRARRESPRVLLRCGSGPERVS
jgi:hypothetical protein